MIDSFTLKPSEKPPIDRRQVTGLATMNGSIDLHAQVFRQQKQLVERDNRLLEKDKKIHDMERLLNS